MAQSICLFHAKPDDFKVLGIRKLEDKSGNGELTELLAGNSFEPLNEEQMKKRLQKNFPYIFNLGGGSCYDNYKQAVDALVKRDLPDIYNDEQSNVIFVPEEFVPSAPRAVCSVEEFDKNVEQLSEDKLVALRINGAGQMRQNIVGDQTERELFYKLKEYFKASTEKEIVVLAGAKFQTPGKKQNQIEEHDVICIYKNLKLMIGIESKFALYGKTIQSANDQLIKLKNLLEKYFGAQFAGKD